jgi:hypothetical protein
VKMRPGLEIAHLISEAIVPVRPAWKGEKKRGMRVACERQ